ncbi:MAG: hypothetical protein ACLTX3_06800 [Lachnospiraceae bacterium]
MDTYQKKSTFDKTVPKESKEDLEKLLRQNMQKIAEYQRGSETGAGNKTVAGTTDSGDPAERKTGTGVSSNGKRPKARTRQLMIQQFLINRSLKKRSVWQMEIFRTPRRICHFSKSW